MTFRIHHVPVTASTNLDARAGSPGDVYTADEQTAGRGRLDHKWHAAPGANLILSAVFDAEGLDPARAATFPLAAGLAVCEAVSPFVPHAAVRVKWPNDVWADGRKLAGILCEREGDRIICGIGLNVKEKNFPTDIAERAVSLALLGSDVAVSAVRDAVLDKLGVIYDTWHESGFSAFFDRYTAIDALKGHRISVRQTDDDGHPLTGLCGGVSSEGALLVDGRPVWSGEAVRLLNS